MSGTEGLAAFMYIPGADCEFKSCHFVIPAFLKKLNLLSLSAVYQKNGDFIEEKREDIQTQLNCIIIIQLYRTHCKRISKKIKKSCLEF